MTWFSTEQSVLLDVIAFTARSGYDTYTWQLAWALDTYLDRQGNRQDYLDSWTAARDASIRLDDRAAEASARRRLAHAFNASKRFAEARSQLRYALRILKELDDRVGLAHTFGELVAVLEGQGRYRESLGYVHESLVLFRATGYRRGVARSLNDAAWVLAQLGDYEAALSSCKESLALHRELGETEGESRALDTLGYVHHNLGRYREAVDAYLQAIRLFRQHLGDRYQEAETLERLGATYLAAGEVSSAAEKWEEALTILSQLHHPRAESVRVSLAALFNGQTF